MNKFKEYKARLEFWWAKRSLVDGRDFELTMDGAGLLVTVLRGKFRGVVYRYGPLSVKEEDEGLIDFQTHILYNPMDGLYADLMTGEFRKLTTNILRILLTEAIPETLAQAKYIEEQVIDENRDTDFSQPLEERDIHEESSPVLEKRVSKRKSRAKAISADSGVHPQVQQPSKPKRARARTKGKKGSDGK